MRWMKIGPETRAYTKLGDKLLYAAARRSELRVARVGAGRNMITCDLWLDAYLESRPANAPERPRIVRRAS